MDIINISSSALDKLESVTISQQPDEMTPSITGTFLIGDEDINSDPPSLSVAVAGKTFSGTPHRSTIRVTADGKRHKTTTYINGTFKNLLQGYGQDILFISCPKSVYDAMEYDEDFVVVKWKEADPYNCGGWTVASIIEEIFSILSGGGGDGAGVGGRGGGDSVNINIPDFDVSSPTVQYQAGNDFAQFIQGLLPTSGGLRYLWFFDENGTLTITLVSTAANFSITTFIDAESIDFGQEHQSSGEEGYTGWRFTGGMAVPVLDEYKYIKTEDITEKTEIETITTTAGNTTIEIQPPEGDSSTTIISAVQPIRGGIPSTTIKTTKRLYDFKGDEFHVVKQTIISKGAIYNHKNENPREGSLSKEEIKYTYENNNPLIYEKSRPKSNSKKASGLITYYASGGSASSQALNSDGPAYLLMDDFTVLTKEEYDDLWPDAGDILLGSYIKWRTNYGKEEEKIAYTQENSSTREYPEGTIKDNSSSKQNLCYRFKVSGFGVTKYSRYYACTEDGKSVLQDLVALVKNTESYISSRWPDVPSTVSLSSGSSSMKTVEIYEKEITEITAKGTYRWKETTKELDLETGVYNTSTRQVSIPGGRVPMEQTKYRKQQLMKDEGDMGDATLVIPFTTQVDTNNREQFNTFCELIKSRAKRPTNNISIQGLSIPYLSGEPYAGGTVTGWSIAVTGDGKTQISVTIEI